MPPRKIKTENPDTPGNGGNRKATLDPKWIITIEGSEFIKYPGLLDYSLQKGVESLVVEPLQLPNAENGYFAVCKATLVSKEGETFTDIGDASPENCSAKVSRHLLRMASTRSLARTLKLFSGIGITAIEELDGDFSGNGNGRAKPPAKKSAQKAPAQAQAPRSIQPRGGNGNGGGPPMSDAQRKALIHISRRQNMGENQLEGLCTEMFNRTFDALTVGEASSMIQHLQAAA